MCENENILHSQIPKSMCCEFFPTISLLLLGMLCWKMFQKTSIRTTFLNCTFGGFKCYGGLSVLECCMEGKKHQKIPLYSIYLVSKYCSTAAASRVGSSFFLHVYHTYAVRHTTFSILWCHFECDYRHVEWEGLVKVLIRCRITNIIRTVFEFQNQNIYYTFVSKK